MKVIGNVRYIPAGVTQYIVDGNDGEINVDTSANAITIVLPNIVNSGYANTDKGFIINDFSGNSATYNITIVASDNTVNSQASILIAVNGGSAKCSIASMNEWFIITEPSTSGMSGSLTANYIPKAVSSSVLADSVIYQNGSKIGINTINPSSNFHVNGVNSAAVIVSSRYSNDSHASGFAGLKARGTESSPSQVLSGDLLINVGAFGYQSGGAFSAAVGKMMFYAKENFTATGQGTAFKLSTTPIGSTVDVFNFGISENGDVNIGDVLLIPTARLYVKGVDSTSSNYALKVDNLASVPLLYARNDGYVNVGLGNITFGTLISAPTVSAIYMGVTPSASNYILAYNAGNIYLSGDSINYTVAGVVKGKTNATYTQFSQQFAVGTLAPSGSNALVVSGETYLKGISTTPANYALKIENSSSSPLLYVRNDGFSNFNNGDLTIQTVSNVSILDVANYKSFKISMTGSYGDFIKLSNTVGDISLYKYTTIGGVANPSSNCTLEIGSAFSVSSLGVKNIAFVSSASGLGMMAIGSQGSASIYGTPMQRFTYDPVSFGGIITDLNNNYHRVGFGVDPVVTHRVIIADGLKISTGGINAISLPVGNAGLVSGDLYVDTSANILANGDLVVGRKV